MVPDAASSFVPRAPLDLRLTLTPVVGKRWDSDGAVWLATRTPAGPATLRLRHAGGSVSVHAWGEGAEWAARRAPVLCGEEDDAISFDPADPRIRRLQRDARGLRIPRTGAVFEALVPTVIGQLVTSIEAHRAYRALVAALGEPAPGPAGIRLPPSPKALASTPYWVFHRFGIERRRAEVIIRAARSAGRLEETVEMDMDAAYRRLRAFPGVGPWTAAKVALAALGDADAVPVGDYHLPHSVGFLLDGTARSTDERMLELLEPYRGHRGRVIQLIIAGGVVAPRFGPHQPLRDIVHS